MKKLILIMTICFFTMINFAFAVELCFEWDPNTEPDLAGYRIFSRVEGQNYNYTLPDWEGVETNCCITGFDYLTTYHFVARAFDMEGYESGDSNEVTWYEDPYINTPPNSPTGLRLIAQ